MKRVQAIKFFISAEYGNVDSGRILDVSDYQAQVFVSHGFAKLLKSQVSPKSKKIPDKDGKNSADFSCPAGNRQEHGLLSPAGTALKKKTVKKSKSGKKKVVSRRVRKKQKMS